VINIKKNSREELRIQLTEYKGKQLVDIRLWRKTFDERGYVRTRKGLTISPYLTMELIGGLVKFSEEEPITERGLPEAN